MHENCGFDITIPGEGSETPTIFFIGEAGGEEELAQERPLVGRSGQRLRAITEKVVGVPWEDTFRDNVFQHRPPGNRNPKVAEVKACVENVLANIRRTDPDVIVLLGGVPVAYFLGRKSKITEVHGQIYSLEIEGRTRTVVPWLHPAFTLRSTQALDAAYEDAEKLREYLNGRHMGPALPTHDTVAPILHLARAPIVECSTHYTFPPGVGDGASTPHSASIRNSWGARNPAFAFDLETTAPTRGGRFDTRSARVVGYSISGVGASAGRFATYFSTPELGAISRLLEDPGWEVICHNTKFEYGVLRRHGVTLRNFHDTRGLAFVLGYPDTTLKGLTRRVLGKKPITFGELAIPKDADFETTRLIHEANYEYGAGDALHTALLYPILRQDAEDEGVLHVYEEIELPLVPVIVGMEEFGVGVDEQKAAAVAKEIGKATVDARNRIQEHLGPINPGSRRQLAAALIEKGAPLREKTTEGNWKTDADTLRAVEDWNPPVIKAVLAYFDMVKRGGFIKQWLRLRGEDGRLHPNINQFGHYEEAGGTGSSPDTGRISESGPNLQQAPNHEDEYWGPLIRTILVPGEGLEWFSVDFAQQEPRIGSWLSKDSGLLSDFNSGIDVYSTIASDVYMQEIAKASHPHERQVGKQFLLAWLYGAGAGKLTELDPGITMAQAKVGLRNLNTRYPLVQNYVRETKALLEDLGYAVTAYGRKRWLPGIWSNKVADRARALRQAANHRIQGTGADVIKQVLARLARRIEAERLPAYIMNTVHDSIDLAVRKGDRPTINRLVTILNEIVAEVIPQVKLPLEFSLGPNWGELGEINGA